MTDLEQRIVRAIAKSMPTKRLAAAVLEEIERTHAVIPREELLHTYTVLMAAGKIREASRLQSIWSNGPIRPHAAESDTQEMDAVDVRNDVDTSSQQE